MMDGVRRPKSLKELLELSVMGCCGAHWCLGPSTMSVIDEEEGPLNEPINQEQSPSIGPLNEARGPLREPMNLAMALAAERQYLAAQNSNGAASPMGLEISRPTNDPIAETASGSLSKMSLMSLLNEIGDEDLVGENKDKVSGARASSDPLCCVCMGRKKGAAFIPCGHTFCRVCSRELWVNRGTCPLCNRPIIEILDIF